MSQTVTIANHEIIPTFNALTALGAFPPGKIALKVARIVAALMPEARLLERELNDLLLAYARKDADGVAVIVGYAPNGAPQYAIEAAQRAEYNEKSRALVEATTEIVVRELLTEADLEAVAAKKELDPGLAAYLLPFVEVPPAAAVEPAA